MIGEFLAAYWSEIVLALVVPAIIGIWKYFGKKIKTYRQIIEEQEQHKTEDLIQEKLEPVIADIEELRDYIRKTSNKETEHINLIISSYRYRLIQLCKLYLRQGYMTQDQYEQLIEFYRLYSALGGNGQAKDYYQRTIQLPIKTQEMGSN